MRVAKIADIEIQERQREKHAPAHIKELKAAILSKGFLSPILLSEQPDAPLPYRLIAGMGRLTAVSELANSNTEVRFERELLPLGSIPYVTIADLSPADLAEAELQENILRANLSFMEEAQARALIHTLRLEQNPTQTVMATSREIAERSGKSPEAENDKLRKALTVVEHKANPRVAKAKSLSAAFAAVMDMNVAQARARLHSLGMVKTDHEVLLGDCRELLPKLQAATFDTVICDPPYGINADDMKRTAGHHYEDSPTYGLEINQLIIREAFRLLKPRGNLFLFCDIDHFVELREYAKRQAFSVWRTPIIWDKGGEDGKAGGHAPHGILGFIRTYELLAFFTKGAKGVKTGGPDIKRFQRPGRSERSHAAEKPTSLLSYFLAVSGDPGDLVLDPCCGSGPIIEAATEQKMKAVCIERDPDYHALAVARLSQLSETPTSDAASAAEAELLA